VYNTLCNINMLTIKQNNFANYYIETGNASEAYRRAYVGTKMSDKTINEASCRLLDNSNIIARVNELKEALQKESDITKEKILNELDAIVFADIRDYVEFDGSMLHFKPFTELTDKQAKAIESIEQGKEGIKLKLHGKNWSIEKVCNMLGYDMPTVIENKGNQQINISVDGKSIELK